MPARLPLWSASAPVASGELREVDVGADETVGQAAERER
jgi:hypothetical protein